MNTIQIVPNAEGVMARPYKSNPDLGYVLIQAKSVLPQAGGEWVRTAKVTHLLKGSVEELKEFITEFASHAGQTLVLPGRIAITEVVEDAIPENLAKRLKKDVTFEEAIEPFLKRKGKDGGILTKGGKRILRFTSYDMAGAMQDTLLDHDGEL